MKRIINYWLLAVPFTIISCHTQKDYQATGTFEATEVLVSAENNGKLVSFNVEEGTVLNAGVEVGIIDTVQLYLKKLQLLATRKSVDNQRPDLSKQIAALQQRLATAVRERDRVQNLLQVDAANRKQLDDWNAEIALLEKQIEAQRSSLLNSVSSLTEQSSSVNIQVAQVDDQLRKCHITSPIAGTVLAKYAECGEFTSVGKPLFKIADLNHVYLRAYITSSQLEHLKIGQKVSVYADYGNKSDKIYPGTITWISSVSEFTPKTILTQDERADLVYAVKIAIKNDGYIKVGMYGGIRF